MATSHTAPPPPGAAPLGADLRRTTDDRMLLGLCGGIARSVGASPLVLRLATLILSFLLLPFVVAAYLGTALIVPRDDGTALLGRSNRDSRDIGVMLLSLAIAAPLVLGTAGSGIFGGLAAWPAVLAGSVVLFGLALWRPAALFGPRPDAPQPRTWSPTAAAAEPATAPTPPAPQDFGDPFHGTVSGPYPDVEPGEAATIVGGASPSDATFVGGAAGGSGDGGADGPAGGAERDDDAGSPASTVPTAARRRRSFALPIFSVLALLPALFIVSVVLGVVDQTWTAWSVLLAVMAVGAAGGAVAIAFVRPSYLGTGFLVALAALLGASAVAVNQLGPVLDDGVGTHTFVPATDSELLPQYTLGVGELNLDLRDMKLRPGTTTTVRTTLGFGQLRVLVPKGVRVVAAPGSETPELTTTATRNGATAKTSTGAPVLALNVRLRGGEVDLLGGSSKYYDRLTVLSSATHGFWGTNDNTGRATGVQPVNRP